MKKDFKNIVSENEILAIESQIEQIERETAAEIVPMIVRSSSSTGHVSIILSLLIFIFLELGEFFTGLFVHPLLWHFSAVVFSALAGLLLSRFLIVQRWFTPTNDLTEQVFERGEIEFYRHNVHATQDRKAILLMISLMEHQAVVLADREIAQKLPPETWEQVIQETLLGIKTSGVGEGLRRGIKSAGGILKNQFPVVVGDRQVLSNRLIIKE